MAADRAPESLAELADSLWLERRLLEYLLAAALLGDDRACIDAAIDDIGAARDRVTGGLATLGIAGARLETDAVRIDDAILALWEELSSVEDVDLAATVMELQLHEAGYEAALAAFARARQASLLDFLR